MSRIIWIGLISLLFCQCVKDKKGNTIALQSDTTATKVVVLCEGNFGWGNAGFDVYYPTKGILLADMYAKQNNSKPLGDVLQSAFLADGILWLVLNNSGKIVGVDPVTFEYKKSIVGLKSPRYAASTNFGTIWVTDIYDNKLAIVNRNSLGIDKKIPCIGWTEQILAVNNEVLVANQLGFVYFFNAATGSALDTISVARGAQWMESDKNGKIWVLASDSGISNLYRINPATKKIEQSFTFPKGTEAQRLAMGMHKDTLFYLRGSVYAMPIVAAALPTVPILLHQTQNFYGLGVDPYSGEVYVADAKDYVSKGIITVINSTGKVLRNFNTGIIPSGFMFYK